MAPRLSCTVYLYIFADQRDWVESIGWESSSALGYLKRSLGHNFRRTQWVLIVTKLLI